MADKSIGDLPKAAALYDNDRMVLEQNGEAKSMEGALLKNYIAPFAQTAEQAAEAAENALEGVKEAIENIPEGTATPIVNDLTTGGASMALSAEMGKELKTELDTKVNPNLLDNWYFGNPVNQRGQTQYIGTGYSIDRWKSNFSGDTVAITDSGVKNTTNSTGIGWHLHQIVKGTAAELAGITIVASAFVTEYKGNRLKPIVSFRDSADAEISALTLPDMSLGVVEVSGEVPSGTVYIRVGLYASAGVAAGDYVELKAVKLEFGTEQTLAHQEDGVWVLNEIPDYSEQLLRCCMSTADSSDTYANNKLTAAAVNAVPLDGSKPMTAPLTIKEVENGYTQLEKNHTQTTDLGTALRDVSKGGSVVALLLKAADQAARLQFGASVYDLIHTGNITGYVKPYADTAQAASEAAESALEGVREAIEAIPEGAATPIVNDLTTGGTSMALSAEMGKQLKTELNTRVNPNLLDNWYFGNPVNQRGQTEYTESGYTVDRWRKFTADAVNLIDSGVQIVYTGTTNWTNMLTQYIDNFEQLRGKTITLSALVTEVSGTVGAGINDGALHTSNHLKAAGLLKVTYTVPNEATTLYTNFHAPVAGPVTATIVAAKLELGTEQTLAHQDANGNWVLNEIPDYNEQLLRCCMSTADSSDTYANNKLTAAAVNAVPLDGSKAMTGNLAVQKTADPSLTLQNTGAGRLAWFILRSTDNTLVIANRAGSNNRNNLIISPETADVANLLRLYNVVDGVGSFYNILHTGNKPSGSYTGNGSATSRTIETGGIGNVCVITGNTYTAIVTPQGAICTQRNATEVISLVATEVNFSNGVLTIASTSAIVNANSATYTYQVL